MAVDISVIEAARIVDARELSFASALEREITDIAKLLVPELDWKNNPIEFRVSDRAAVNAGIYTNEKPPVVILDRGLLEFVKNKNQLAFAIGHELGHDHICKMLGLGNGVSSSKVEEGGADIFSTERCLKAGFGYRCGIEFFRGLEELTRGNKKEELLGGYGAVFDPHPMNNNRIVVLETWLANENLFKSGTVKDTPDIPLDGALGDRNQLSQLQHKSFLDRFLPGNYEALGPADQLEWMRKALEATIDEGLFIEESRDLGFMNRFGRYAAKKSEPPSPETDKTESLGFKLGDLFKKFRKKKPAPDENIPAADKDFSDFFKNIDPETFKNWPPAPIPKGAGKSKGYSPPRNRPLTRYTHILKKLEEIKSDPSDQKARQEAERIIDIVHRLDPHNNKFRFDSFYRAAAKSIGGKQEGLAALGPFAEFGATVHKFVSAAPDQREEESHRLIGVLSKVRFYMTVEESTGNRPMMDFRGNQSHVFYQMGVFRMLQNYSQARIHAGDGGSPAYTEALWMMGGAFDEKFRAALSNDQLKSLRHIQPVFVQGYADQFVKLQKSIDERLQRGAQEEAAKTATSFMQDPQKFVFAHQQKLFPKGNPQWARPEHLDISEQIRSEMMTAFQSGNPALVADATAAMAALYADPDHKQKDIRGWLAENGHEDRHNRRDGTSHLGKRARKSATQQAAKDRSGGFMLSGMFNDRNGFYDPYTLGPDHPFVRLLLEAAPYAGRALSLQKLGQIVDYEKLGETALLRVMDIDPPGTIADVWKVREALKSNTQNADHLIQHIARKSIERILEADTNLRLDGENMLALVRLNERNGAFARNEPHWLLGPDLPELIHQRIWSDFSADHFSAFAKKADATQLLDIYQFLEENHLFSGKETQRVIADAVKEKINGMSGTEKGAALKLLLMDGNSDNISSYDRKVYTVKDIGLRDFAARAYAEHLKETLGQDTGDSAYTAKVKPVIERIISNALPRDRVFILENVATALNIQTGLAEHIHTELKPDKEDLAKSYLPVMGIEALMHKLESDDGLRQAMISYLSDPLSQKSVEALSGVILRDEQLVKRLANVDFVEVAYGRVVLDKFEKDRLNKTLTELHDNFSSLSIDKKSGILSVLLIPGEARADEAKTQRAYDSAIQTVFKKVFRPGMENMEEAQSFAQSYLETAQSFERPLILAALMALSVGGGGEDKSVAAHAAHMMRLLGPAYVKLGQGINSNPSTPENWKNETAGLKSDSQIESRWETILESRKLLPPEVRDGIRHYGPVLGAASFNTAMQVVLETPEGPRDIVALVERPHAWSRADTGFTHMAEAVTHWNHPAAQQQKDTIREMITEAREVARIETDPALTERQYAQHAERYAGDTVEFAADKMKLTVEPVSLYYSDDRIKLISLAPGAHFSELPETTPAELEIKKKAAKGYMALELSHILSGHGFDCDRHGRQMKVDATDTTHIRLNVYDPGGEDLEQPTSDAKKALGSALNRVAMGLQGGQNPVALFEESLKEAAAPETQRYLKRTRKAWLALQDFQKYIPPQEMAGVLQAATGGRVDQDILSEFKLAQMLRTLEGGVAEFRIGKAASHSLPTPVRRSSKRPSVAEQLAV